MTAATKESASPFHYAKELGKRLEALGLDVHASQHERYLVLLQDAPGEILDLGRPLRGSRIFGNEAVRRNVPVVAAFTKFAAEDGLTDCMFWGVGLTGAKAAADDLVAAMKAFNSQINVEFSELRKKQSFELLLLAIHPRFDTETGLFDLHAHFICRVPPEHREAAHRRLMSKFSKIDLNTKPIRNPAAVATYMLWGIWRNESMLSWPDHALRAAWSVAQHRFRLFRTGGAFAKWRACGRSAPARLAKATDKATIEKNRQETADTRPRFQTGDKLLSKVMVHYEGRKVAALLYEVISPKKNQTETMSCSDADPMYTSATIRVSQESKDEDVLRNSDQSNGSYSARAGFVRKWAASISRALSFLKSKIDQSVDEKTRRVRKWTSRLFRT